MSKVFVIPDVHLKPWIFEKASEKISEGEYDFIIMLGDLVDDWGQERNLNLYSKTFDSATEFIRNYQNTLFCYGNHDLSYPWEKLETGYSPYAHELCVERLKQLVSELPKGNAAFIHKIDTVLFSHGGVTLKFIKRIFGNNPGNDFGDDLDFIISFINKLGKQYMWADDSPIWSRPQAQYDNMELFPQKMLQVVGHSPVEQPLLERNLLSLDTFSTYADGKPIGDEGVFCWIDTEKEEYYTL